MEKSKETIQTLRQLKLFYELYGQTENYNSSFI